MDICTNTEELVDHIWLDLLPPFATMVDFGMDGPKCIEVFGAYQWGFKRGTFTQKELNEALGDGPALTKLVRRTYQGQQNPYGFNLIIRTTWDELKEEEE